MGDTFEIPSGELDGPGRPKLEDVLNAEFELERWHERGRRSQHIAVLASVAMAYCLFAANGASTTAAKLAVSLWLTAMIALVFSLLGGKRALDRVDRLVAASGGRRIRHHDPMTGE